MKLITQFMNAIYGTIVAIIIYYYMFLKTLKLNKSKMNPYDLCVSNLMVNGLQHSIIFHVDDFNLSHNYPKVNYNFIELLCD